MRGSVYSDIAPRSMEEYRALLDWREKHPITYAEALVEQRGGYMEDVARALLSPPPKLHAVPTEDSLRDSLRLPASFGTSPEVRERMDASFFAVLDHAGGVGMMHQDLLSHASELGQMPISAFLGYGALQNISQNGMIRACVQTVADDITKKWIELTGGEKEDTARINKLTELMDKRYHLQKIFHQAIESVGYYGGAFVFIDTGVGEESLHLPLAINNKSAELRRGPDSGRVPLRFVVIDPINVTPAEYNADNPLRPDYMRPSAWWVLGKKVHASRLLALYDNEPPLLLRPAYNFLGIPRAQILWDYVIHWNEARTYATDLLKKVSLLVVKTNTDQIFATPEGVRMFDIRINALQRYRDNNSIYVCDKEQEDVNNVQTTIAGATDVVRQTLEMVAAINRTPAVKLLGISPSGFNATGESDITNYYDHIQAQQELYRDPIERCIKAIQLAEFGSIDSTIGFEFVELARDNESARAMNANTRMGMLSSAVQSQAISTEEMRQAIQQDPDMGLDFITGAPPDVEPQDFSDMEGDPGVGGSDMASLFGALQSAGKEEKPEAPKDDASKYYLGEPLPSPNDAEVNDA